MKKFFCFIRWLIISFCFIYISFSSICFFGDTMADAQEPETEKTLQRNAYTKDKTSKFTRYKHSVYLTFDDGPNKYTPAILDILKERNIRATFFVNGYPGNPDIYQRILAEKHSIGNHTWSHYYKTVYKDMDGFSGDLLKMDDYLKNMGYTTKLFRFPGGSNNRAASKAVLKHCKDYLASNGFSYLDWNIDSSDTSGKHVTVDIIKNSVLEDIDEKDTAVVLFHNKKKTAEALPEILDELIRRGYEFKILDPLQNDPTVINIKFK